MNLRSGKRCFAAGRHGRVCDHARQRHHIVKQQHIRLVHASLRAEHRRGAPAPAWKLQEALKDPRLWRWVCWAHHQLEASGKLEVGESDLPDGFWDAVAEYGLRAYVPEYLTDPEEATMATCKSCGTEIIWRHLTPRGRSAPIDAEPHPEGNIRLHRDGKTASVVTRGELEDAPDRGDLHRSHFATCPQAKEHRKSRR